MKYNVAADIEIVSKIINISYSELASMLGVARSTITRIVNKQTNPNEMFLESFYTFVYEQNIKLNELKIQYAKSKYKHVLFHGAKAEINGGIDLNHSRNDIDVGMGFYLGESYEQSSSYIFPYKKSSIYLLDISKTAKLKIKEFGVDLDWMLMVSFFRGQLNEYRNSRRIKELIEEISKYDIIIAPIADNNMYETMNQFARGDITDQQAIHALSASKLGKQHVLKTEKACKCAKVIDRLYLCKEEKNDIEKIRKESATEAYKEGKEAINKYRRQGLYVEEILK